VPGPPCAADDLTVVLPDPATRVHREADVGAALATRAEGPEQVAAEEPATGAGGSSVSLWRRAPVFRAIAVAVAIDVRARVRGFPPRPPGALCRRSPPCHALTRLSAPARVIVIDSADFFLERETGDDLTVGICRRGRERERAVGEDTCFFFEGW